MAFAEAVKDETTSTKNYSRDRSSVFVVVQFARLDVTLLHSRYSTLQQNGCGGCFWSDRLAVRESVPVFGVMAFIRSRIGRFDTKRHQVKEAKSCLRDIFVTTVAVVFCAVWLMSYLFINSTIINIGLVWTTGFGATLILIIGLNVLIRLFSTG